MNDNGNKSHWKSQKVLCFLVFEGGPGFRALQDICDAFSSKFQWNFRTKNTLLKDFLEAKYCKRAHPVAKKCTHGQSHSWKRMMDIKKMEESYILQKIGKGLVSIWWDNWTILGSLANLIQLIGASKHIRVQEFIQEGAQRYDKLLEVLPVNMISYVLEVQINEYMEDKPIQIHENSDVFTCKSAWQISRKKKVETFTSKNIWHRKLPFKISFFMVRLLHARIPTDDATKKVGITTPSMCCSCTKHEDETTTYLFSYSQIARHVWSYFCRTCSISPIIGHTRQILMNWQLRKPSNGVQEMLFQCFPSLIC